MKLFEINGNDAGQRVDKFVLKVTSGLPNSLLYKAIRTKKIKVNRKRCEPGQILQKGDTLQLFLSPDFFPENEENWKSLTPTVTSVFEDENLLICHKPIGLSCHSDQTQKSGTLIDHIKAYLYKKGEFCPEQENSFAPALCNRIDRNTSGLVICAKNSEALREMNEMIRLREVEKRYLAWILGKWDRENTVTVYLKKDTEKNRVSVSRKPMPDHLTAITEFHPIFFDKEKNRELVEVILHTGRTHQIRATAAFFGHPLVGDSKYGKDHSDPDFPYQALKAESLTFHPKESSLFYYLNNIIVKAPDDPLFCPKK